MRNSIITVGMSGSAFTITQENFNSGDKVNSSQFTTSSRGGFAHAPQVMSLINTLISARPVPNALVMSPEAEANLGEIRVGDILRAVKSTRSEEMA